MFFQFNFNISYCFIKIFVFTKMPLKVRSLVRMILRHICIALLLFKMDNFLETRKSFHFKNVMIFESVKNYFLLKNKKSLKFIRKFYNGGKRHFTPSIT